MAELKVQSRFQPFVRLPCGQSRTAVCYDAVRTVCVAGTLLPMRLALLAALLTACYCSARIATLGLHTAPQDPSQPTFHAAWRRRALWPVRYLCRAMLFCCFGVWHIERTTVTWADLAEALPAEQQPPVQCEAPPLVVVSNHLGYLDMLVRDANVFIMVRSIHVHFCMSAM
jgi:hypothetical protein